MISPSIYFKKTCYFEIGASISSGHNMFGERIFGFKVNFFWLEFYMGLVYFPRF
jgi:hypothetical protein